MISTKNLKVNPSAVAMAHWGKSRTIDPWKRWFEPTGGWWVVISFSLKLNFDDVL